MKTTSWPGVVCRRDPAILTGLVRAPGFYPDMAPAVDRGDIASRGGADGEGVSPSPVSCNGSHLSSTPPRPASSPALKAGAVALRYPMESRAPKVRPAGETGADLMLREVITSASTRQNS